MNKYMDAYRTLFGDFDFTTHMSYMMNDNDEFVSHVDGKMPWYDKNSRDVQDFKKFTLNRDCYMGYNTFCSLPKPLSGRSNVVCTRRHDRVNDLSLKFNSYNIDNWLNLTGSSVTTCSLSAESTLNDLKVRNAALIGGQTLIDRLLCVNSEKNRFSFLAFISVFYDSPSKLGKLLMKLSTGIYSRGDSKLLRVTVEDYKHNEDMRCVFTVEKYTFDEQ